LFVLVSFFYIFLLRVLDKAEYSAFESALNSSIVSYRICWSAGRVYKQENSSSTSTRD